MEEGGTRQQILVHAARLFGRHGYHGTTTREIADAVGIRQPSLFYHFSAKHVILSELVDADLAQTFGRLQEARALDAPWAERFHYFLTISSHDYLTLPYDARGYYSDAIFTEPEFERQREEISRFHEEVRALVVEGIRAGEFMDVDAEFVQRAITGLQFEGMRERETNASAPVAHRPLQVSDFILRAVLVDPFRLDAVRAATQFRLDGAVSFSQ
ncbi:TetR/AcrR family transcriptional regulator [Microbacterium trichothecenolyticum]|uniref:AcrR family transcriptional regulator n=1 Tax=Microbacterium trichothecenolyticum TaxID=69370 RepID=A0ABU0TWK8_MICTR|nr:TetR/AcrR family transcriptional regulator [Microbacterium trichothecenolyticum]MDQ1124040.1 AcrR family transcriptional regulator [Microbacterium trichothecenolyticum]